MSAMRLLLVKMSSLGDVVHTLVPVTDAIRARPDLTIDWVVEEAYSAIPAWHPSVNRIIPVALRRWRKSPWTMIRDNEWFQFRGELRREEYDLVLDAQGLMKSGWIGLQARGPVVGRNRNSAREPLAAAFYKNSHEIDLVLPEVEQLRQLFARALDYPEPNEPAQFGIDHTRIPSSDDRDDYAILAHGAAWESKLWPVASWMALGRELAKRHLRPLLPWGNEREKNRAQDIAAACGGEVLPRLEIPALASTLRDAKIVVGLDTGITHISIALGTPTVTLYGPTVPVYDKVAGDQVIHLTSTGAVLVDTNRTNTVSLSAVLEAVAKFLG
jgi:heptosyltransferase I